MGSAGGGARQPVGAGAGATEQLAARWRRGVAEAFGQLDTGRELVDGAGSVTEVEEEPSQLEARIGQLEGCAQVGQHLHGGLECSVRAIRLAELAQRGSQLGEESTCVARLTRPTQSIEGALVERNRLAELAAVTLERSETAHAQSLAVSIAGRARQLERGVERALRVFVLREV